MQLLSLVFLTIAVAYATSANIHPFFMQYREGSRYFLAPTKDGKIQIVDRLAVEKDARFEASTDVDFLLYTRSNPSTAFVLKNGDISSLSSSNYDKNKPVKIIAHGWNSGASSDVNNLVRDAFLSALDVNVIFVDWSSGANGLYGTAVNNVPKVGEWVANLVDWLVDQNTPIGNFHIMGHSLGGHITGFASRLVTRGVIPYATAFDPAGPSWGAGTDRISPSDAGYVEVIHTDAGLLGLTDAVGHNDFYPNGGSGQPGCSIISIGCSHSRSYELFADSIDHNGFMADQCATVAEATGNNCSNLSRLWMGGARVKDARGIFYLTTNSKVPFYQG